MIRVLFLTGLIVILLGFFVAPVGTSNTLIVSAILFVAGIVLSISRAGKVKNKIN